MVLVVLVVAVVLVVEVVEVVLVVLELVVLLLVVDPVVVDEGVSDFLEHDMKIVLTLNNTIPVKARIFLIIIFCLKLQI